MDEAREVSEPADVASVGGRGVWIGLGLTIVLLAVAFGYLWMKADQVPASNETASGSSLGPLLRLPLADVGLFVTGVAGALALLWIILAYWQQSHQLQMQRHELALQRRELALQRQETNRLGEEARAQVEVLKQTSMIARRDAFVRLLELYERKLALEASQISSLTAATPALSDNHQSAWKDYELGDRGALFRNLIRQLIRGGHADFMSRVDRIANGRALLERFSATASELLAEATSVDEKMDALCRSSEWSFLSGLLDRAQTELPAAARAAT